MGRRRRIWPSIRLKLILILLTLLCLGIYIHVSTGTVIDQVTRHESELLAQQTMNQAFSHALEQESAQLQDLVRIVPGNGTDAQTISVDSQKVNQLRASISGHMIEDLQQMEVQKLSIPLGSLIGSDLIGARGPGVKFKLYPSGQFTGRIVSEFDSAGINQTRHRLVFEVQVDMVCVAPFYRSAVNATSQFLLSETVVVGEVPDYYTQVIGEDTVSLEKAGSYQGLQTKPD